MNFNEFLPFFGCGLMIISLGYIFTFWFRAVFALDKILKYEYENLHEQWIKDRQPRGMFWKPKVKPAKIFDRFFSRINPGVHFFKLLFTTPEWIKQNTETTNYIKEFRKFVLLWNVGVLVWFFVLFPGMGYIFTPR
jgi:hypothetical protein